MTDLNEGQWMIGDLVFGAGTQLSISSFEQVGYTVTPGDYSIPQTDETRFRKDFLQPGVIQMTVSAVDNYILDAVYLDDDPAPQVQSAAELMEQFMKEWRADEVRGLWGYVKPLTYKKRGQVRKVYGRPRDIAAPPRGLRPGWHDMVCAYQRADTLSYAEDMSGVTGVKTNASGRIERGDGSAPTWFEIYLSGPIINPKMIIGPYTIELAYSLAAGELVAISSYPWDRRAISSNTMNLAPKMIGNSPYLSDLRFPAGDVYNVSLQGTGITSATALNVFWREAYHSL